MNLVHMFMLNLAILIHQPTYQKRKSSLNPFGTKAFTFTSKEDLMKNLPNMMGGSSFGASESPIFKLNVREYNDSNLKVGDKVTIEIKKSSNDSGI